MQIRLNDTEIREILAEAIANKTDYKYQVKPENCWFEVEAGEINEKEMTVDDIHNVQFIFDESHT